MPKRSRPQSEGGEKEDARVSTSDSSEPLPSMPEPDSKSVAVFEIILSVAQAHQAHCEYTEEQTRGLLRKPVSASPVSGFVIYYMVYKSVRHNIRFKSLLPLLGLMPHLDIKNIYTLLLSRTYFTLSKPVL